MTNLSNSFRFLLIKNTLEFLIQYQIAMILPLSNLYGSSLAPVVRAQESKFDVRFSNIFSLENV